MKVEWSSAQDPQEYATHEFVAQVPNHRVVTGCLWIPNGPTKQNMLMAFGHGASGNRYQMPIPHLARRLAKQGIASLAMDGPVHGLRQRKTGDRLALTEEMRRPSMIEDMIVDWQSAVKIAELKLEFEVKKFGYFGLSMGSIFGIPYLANRVRERQPIDVATLGLLGTTGPVAAMANRLKRDASTIESPVFFVMQLEDELFPRDGCLELFDTLGSTDKRLHANPGLHPAVPAEEIDFCFNFVSERLLG